MLNEARRKALSGELLLCGQGSQRAPRAESALFPTVAEEVTPHNGRIRIQVIVSNALESSVGLLQSKTMSSAYRMTILYRFLTQ